jgi:pimeloyl-ACP methyl ester carboxylesterase
MLFRKFLVRIRKEFNTNKGRLFGYSFGVLCAFIAFGIAADGLLPFNGLWNALRTIILIPTSLSAFVLGYAISLELHYRKIANDPEWRPYRSRFSPTWRRRISAIAAAFAIVFVYANGYRIGYTLVSSLFVSVVIAIFAFLRTTQDEAKREEFNIPDSRDTNYETHRRKLAADRLAAQKRREEEKKNRKTKNKKPSEISEKEF